MKETTRLRWLRLALCVFGLVFTLGFYPLTVVWPSGWTWHTGQSHYLSMIIGIYATLGVFLLLAARNPAQHVSLISFVIWSSVVHALIMVVQSIAHPEHIGHLYGDVPALFLIAGVLGFLCPAAARVGSTRPAIAPGRATMEER
jgi:FtsH-binding integral membrane protein